MTRKLAPQEHLENVIIQQNEGRPVNQYTALLHNPGTKRWERPESMTEYGGDGKYSQTEQLALSFIAPIPYFFWSPVVLLLGYVTGYLNMNSKVCRLIVDTFEYNWFIHQGLPLLTGLVNIIFFGILGLAVGNPLMCILVPNLVGGIWIIANEFISQRKMFKETASWD